MLNEKLAKGETSKKVNKAELRDAILAGEDISSLDYSEVRDMSNMFIDCRKLKTIPDIDTSKVTDMSHMFQNCSSLRTIPELDTSNVADMDYMFSGCSELVSIPDLNTSKVRDMKGTFNDCDNLETFKNPENFIKYDFKNLPKILKKYPKLMKS
jgi:surface protein